MLRWTLVFIFIALIFGFLGFGGILGMASGIARILFFVFVVLFLFSIIKNGKNNILD